MSGAGRLNRELGLPRPPAGDLKAIGALAVLVALLLWPALFAGEVFFERDIHSVFHAQAEAFARSVGLGSWPVWDPGMGFGQPLLGNATSQVLYPPNWTALLLDPSTQYTLYVAVHLLAGSADMLVLTGLITAGILVTRLDPAARLGGANRGRVGTAALAGLFGAALSAAQWLPTLALVRGAPRGAMLATDRAVWSIHPWRLASSWCPSTSSGCRESHRS